MDAPNKLTERTQQKSAVYLNYAAMNPSLTNDRCSFWEFRFYPSSDMEIKALTTYFKDRPDIKSVYLLSQDYTRGHQLSKSAE